MCRTLVRWCSSSAGSLMNIVNNWTLFSLSEFSLICIVQTYFLHLENPVWLTHPLYLNGQVVSLVSDQDGSGFAYYNLEWDWQCCFRWRCRRQDQWFQHCKIFPIIWVLLPVMVQMLLVRGLFVWTSGGGYCLLVGGHTTSEAWDISADGSTIVGSLLGGSGQEAFRWTSGSGELWL